MGQVMATDPARSTTPFANRPRQLWQVPVFLLGLLAVVAVPALRPLWGLDTLAGAESLLRSAREALDQSPPDAARAAERGQRVLALAPRYPQLAGEAAFVVGSAYLRLAAEPGAEAARARELARKYLEQADSLGVAEEDRPRLQYRLGKVRLLLNADPAQVVAALTKGMESPDDPAEAYDLLAQAYLRLTPPNPEKALEATNQQLTRLLPTGDTRLQAQARLRQGELHLRLKNVAEGRQALERITNDGTGVFFTAQALLAQSYEAATEWARAARHWEQARADPRLAPAAKGRALYHLGVCLAQDQRAKEAATVWEEALPLGGETAQAAALRLAELRLESEPRAAADSLAAALQAVRGPDDYHNPLVPLDEARPLVEKAGQLARARGDWETAQRLAELYGRLAAPGGADVLAGLTADAWADALIEQAKKAPADQAVALEEQARARRRLAGQAYEKAAAGAPAGPEQANWLSNSADRYLRANDLTRAVEVLTRYTQLDGVVSEEQLTRAWFELAQARHRLQQYAAARDAYRHCLKPGGPYAIRARHGLAKLDLAENRFDEAEQALQENLKALREASPPDHAQIEPTLYALALVAYNRQAAVREELREYGTAEQRLLLALQQYPNSPEANQARLTLASCYWFRAAMKSKILDANPPGKGGLSDDERKLYQRQQVELLGQAAEQYERAEKTLLDRQRSGAALSPEEGTQLKNGAFHAVDCYFWMGRYEDAVQRYKVLALRYQQLPEELIARYQIFMIYFLYLKQPDRAAEEFARFRAAFDKVPESAYDGSTQQHVRAFWVKMLDDATKAIEAARQAASR